MKTIRIYDNGGKTFDRYTAVYMGWPEGCGLYAARGMSEHPFHPQGFGQFCAAMPGRHLGKRIAFAELPTDCQRLIQSDLDEDF
jgi:hypothetical protein